MCFCSTLEMTMTGAIITTISTDMFHHCGPRVVFCAETRTPEEDRATREAHARWVVSLFSGESGALRSGRHVAVMERLVADHANLLAALRWASEPGRDAGARALAADLAVSGAAFVGSRHPA